MTETTLQTHIENFRHPDQNLRSEAAIALGKLGGADALNALLASVGHEPDLYVREDITWALVRFGEQAVAPLIELLRDPSPAVRHHAAHTLGKIRDARAAGALIGALNDSETSVVLKAAFTLGQLRAVEAIPALVRLLAHESREVQSTLVTVLDEFGEPALAPLNEALHDENPQIRALAAEALGQL